MTKQIILDIQEIIDFIAKKEYEIANSKIELVQISLNDLLDTSVESAFLREISKYQVLIEHLLNKLNQSK